MLKNHKYSKSEAILTLDFGSFQITANLNTTSVDVKSKDTKMDIDYPGEYEVEGILIHITQTANEGINLITIFDEKVILILPNLTTPSTLLTHEIMENLHDADLVIIGSQTDTGEEKKLIQILEPRVLVKLGIEPKQNEISLQELNLNKMSFPEETTNVYCVN